MKKRVGILTSGGDCPGLNATIRGVAKALYARMGDNVEIVGILNGYSGLINGDYKEMSEDDFRGILTLGGTILGTKRTPFKMMRVVEDDNVDKVAAMKKTYKDAKLDCLLCLGGNGTHKTANLLSQEGLNIIGLPKTIDNDIFGTDVTFGFHTAVDIATEVIDRIHTTAGSHSRVMCIEIMGNKAGWLTLYSGIAGGADIILLPEQPYDIDRVCEAVERRAKRGSNFSIIAVAEGAMNVDEAKLEKSVHNASALSRPLLEKLEQNDGNLTLRGKTYHVEVPQRVKQAVIPVLAVGLYYGIDSGTVAAMARYIFMFMSMKPDSADVVVRAAFCHHCEDYISLMEYYPPADHGMEAYTRA